MTRNPIVRGWAMECARRIGFTYGAIVECQLAMLERWTNKTPDMHSHLLSSITYSLMEWQKIAIRHSSTQSLDVDQIFQVIRTGRLKSWLEKVRSHMSMLSAAAGRVSDLTRDNLLYVSNEVQQMRNYVDELMLG